MRWTIVISLAWILGCGGVMDALDSEPARLDMDEPASAILDDEPHVVTARVLTERGKELPEEADRLSWSATPTSVAEVQGGVVRCLSNGDASVIVSGKGVSATFPVRCRIVDRIVGPSRLELLVGEPDGAFSVSALGRDGRELPEVVPEVRSSDPTVVDVERGVARAVTVGRATLTASAGRASTEIPVMVMERMKTDTLALGDGETIAYTLVRGNYLVEVNARASDGSSYGVTVMAAGGGCPGQAESTQHRFQCAVTDTTSLVISNPTSFGWGPPEMGNVTIYRTP